MIQIIIGGVRDAYSEPAPKKERITCSPAHLKTANYRK
jgi:hypothetical protein